MITNGITIGRWALSVAGDYAQPTMVGGGYCEVQDNGDFEVAFETDQSTRDMGLDAYLLTKVPVEVIRALLANYDAKKVGAQ